MPLTTEEAKSLASDHQIQLLDKTIDRLNAIKGVKAEYKFFYPWTGEEYLHLTINVICRYKGADGFTTGFEDMFFAHFLNEKEADRVVSDLKEYIKRYEAAVAEGKKNESK